MKECGPGGHCIFELLCGDQVGQSQLWKLLLGKESEGKAAEQKQNKQKKKPFPKLLLALGEVISYLRDFGGSDTKQADATPVTVSPFPTAKWPICLRLEPKINSLIPPYPPRDHSMKCPSHDTHTDTRSSFP